MLRKRIGSRRLARGAYTLELALSFPVVIILVMGMLDVATILRNKNALKEGVEATVRCLRTTDSECGTGSRNASSPGNPLYRVYIQPRSYDGDTQRYNIDATTYKAPELEATISADILASATSSEQQQRRYPVTHEARKHLDYVEQDFGYSITGFSQPVAYVVNPGAAVAVPHTLAANWNITSGEGQKTLSTFKVTVPNNIAEIQNGPCYQGVITAGTNGLPANCLLKKQGTAVFVPVMIAIKGQARSRNGVQGSTASLGLDLNYQGTTQSLGGRQFTPPAPGLVSPANFVPRGAVLGTIDGSAVSEYSEVELYTSKTTYVPMGEDVTIELTISGGINTSWELTDLAILAPRFSTKSVDLQCVLNSNPEQNSRQTCSSLARGNCHTVPELGGLGTLTLTSEFATELTKRTAACYPAHSPLTETQPPITIGGQTCNEFAVNTSSGAPACSPVTVEHTCSDKNFGTAVRAGPDGKIHGGSELLALCNPTASKRVVARFGSAPASSNEIVATERLVTVQEQARFTPVNCVHPGVDEAFALLTAPYAKPHISHIRETGNLGDIPSWPVPDNNVSCFKALGITSRDSEPVFTRALGEVSYLLQSHKDLGCSEESVLQTATDALARTGIMKPSFKKITTGTFLVENPKDVDSCTPLHPKPGSENTRRYLGTFEEGAIPAECLNNPACTRELAGFTAPKIQGNSLAAPSSDYIKQAIARGVTTISAYAGAANDPKAEVITAGVQGSNITVTGSLHVPLLLQRTPHTLTYTRTSISEQAAVD